MDPANLFGQSTNPLDALGHRPELPPAIEEDDDEDIDETVAERLIGLTEMFPEKIRTVFGSVFGVSFSLAKGGFTIGRSLLWILASSATIMVLPIVFESERAQQQEQQLQQQRQILLGPNAAVSGSNPGGMPGMAPPPPR
ncbi:hypothetical protein SNE40_005330 [Patella caerulea]|uniref:Mitochondrial import receptor subunit TOM22 homolog n=1 Tax=Patella caerulea TaxID=87958 RepID=A0AAN8K3E6_PATCE